jgi:hypothetical protein
MHDNHSLVGSLNFFVDMRRNYGGHTMCNVNQVLKVCSLGEHDALLTFDHLLVICLDSLVMTKPILFVRIAPILVVYLRLGLDITFISVFYQCPSFLVKHHFLGSTFLA